MTPPDETATTPDDEAFAHGVASFDPTSTAVLIWTRAPGVDTLAWEVATDPAMSGLVRSGQVAVDHDADHTATVDVDELPTATNLWYRFRSGSSHSPIGRTRTLPDSGAEEFRLATVCCARYAAAPLTVYRALSEHDVDLVVHLGDSIYEDAEESGPRKHDPPHAAVTLEDYRRRHAQLRADPDARALYQRHPMAVIWDDHDLADNAWQGGAKGHDPDRDGPWEDRVEAASRAHHEWLPARLRDPDNRLLRWRSVYLGDLAELILLDTRYFGRDEQADADGAKPHKDPNRSMLGDEQRRWAHERVSDTSRPWALIGSQVVMNPMVLPTPEILDSTQRLSSGYAVIDGELLRTDQWDGYPAERDALVEAIDRRGGGVVVLSGDVHSAWAFEGPCSADGRPVAVEFTCPAAASTPMGRQLPAGGRLLEKLVEAMPGVRYAELLHQGFTTIEVTPDKVQSSWWLIDSEDPEARRRAGATWAVDRDNSGHLYELETPTPVDPRRPVEHEAGVDDEAEAGIRTRAPFDAAAVPDRPPKVGRKRRRRDRLVRVLGVGAAVVGAYVAGLRRR